MESEYERTYERAWSILRQKVMNDPELSRNCLLINELMTDSWAEAVEFERRQAKEMPESGQEEPKTPIPDFLKDAFDNKEESKGGE